MELQKFLLVGGEFYADNCNKQRALRAGQRNSSVQWQGGITGEQPGQSRLGQGHIRVSTFTSNLPHNARALLMKATITDNTQNKRYEESFCLVSTMPMVASFMCIFRRSFRIERERYEQLA